jgi:hypothetical protein
MTTACGVACSGFMDIQKDFMAGPLAARNAWWAGVNTGLMIKKKLEQETGSDRAR